MVSDPMKIIYLRLVNFKCIESGLKKRLVVVDLRETKHPLNVFIGKIGSGKTFILSHMQPFATLGTLDIRNQDDQIIDGVDGEKEIWYQVNNTKYEIHHDYIWNEKNRTHSTKSFITKDGEELNPTGNVTSFKYIINTEFGMDMSYLRLVRIGANVTGVLDLSATERKNYIASMLSSTEVILLLHKKLREELRNFNAKVSVLSNKLTQIGLTKEMEYQKKYEDISDEVAEAEKEINRLQTSILQRQAEIAAIAPRGYDELIQEITIAMEEYDKLREERNALSDRLAKLEGNPDSNAIAKKIGSMENELSSTKKQSIELEEDYERKVLQLHKIDEKRMILQNDRHLQTLKESYERLKEELELIWKRIKNFHCDYSSSYLKALVSDLHTVDMLIADISQYDADMIRHIYLSDASIIPWARQKGEILTGYKINLQKKMNNLAFSAKYEIDGVMYTPPFCPTKNCPYKKTHPYTLADGKSEKEINREVEELRQKMEEADKKLYMYAEYPAMYSKINSIKERFRELMPILSSIGCLVSENAIQIMTQINKRVWYNYDRIIDTQELALMKESYYEKMNSLRKMEEELRSYEEDSMEKLNAEYDTVNNELQEITDKIRCFNDKIKALNGEIQDQYELYSLMLQKSMDEEKLKDLNRSTDKLSELLADLSKTADKIAPYEMVISRNKYLLIEKTEEHETLVKEKNRLTTLLNDLKFTKQEMEEVLLQQKYLSLMVDATSSKEGIPLELINDFVVGCKDIINDLTFDIFEEDIQLEDFIIDEKEFYVPYSINGKYIEDVTKASQGQRSLFDIAFAFAFLQESDIPYNIPLLDEVDAPLHKNEHAKFLSMVLRQMKATGSIQSFLITHSILENVPVNFIATTEEDVNLQNGSTLLRLYE